ncbi:MAG: Gfo/Idh/MocA family oxidoreductase [Lentisphaerae bacterium]|nr:Gfo/Idh/MocA family oxidoreductase [Lentisphaerota bacterium]
MTRNRAPVNFALIGCGRISRNHAAALADPAVGGRLVAVCDVVPERAKELAAQTGAEAYTDYARMLARDDVAAVSVCTPSGLHPEHGILAAEAGKHVVCEKPIAIDLESCDRLISVCRSRKRRLFVVLQNRLNATMRLLKGAIDRGRFGRIYGVHAQVLWQRPQGYYDQAPWRGTRALDGGALLNQASHYVDSLVWLGGAVAEVTAFTGRLARNIECEDSGAVVVRFRSGAIGSINASMLVYPRNFEGSVTVLGEHGTVKLGGIAINRFEKWEFESYDDDDKLVVESNYEPPNVYGFGHTAYYRGVVEALSNGGEPDTDGMEGRRSLELILAAYKSAAEGRKVMLPL